MCFVGVGVVGVVSVPMVSVCAGCGRVCVGLVLCWAVCVRVVWVWVWVWWCVVVVVHSVRYGGGYVLC